MKKQLFFIFGGILVIFAVFLAAKLEYYRFTHLDHTKARIMVENWKTLVIAWFSLAGGIFCLYRGVHEI